MTTPYTFKFDGGNWIAHAVALDLVAVDRDPLRALIKLKTICTAQVGFGRKHGRSLREVYFAAKGPFFYMEFDPDEYLKGKEIFEPPQVPYVQIPMEVRPMTPEEEAETRKAAIEAGFKSEGRKV